MINISEDDAKLFEQNGYSKEHVGATVTHYRQQGLSDDEIQSKINARLSGWRTPQPVQQPVIQQPVQQPVAQEYDVQKAINELPMQHTVLPLNAVVSLPEQPTQSALTGGISQNYIKNWDKKGRIYYTDENGNKVKPDFAINPLQKFGRNIQTKLTNLNAFWNRPSQEQQKQKEELGKFIALTGATMMPTPFNPAIAAGAKAIARPLTALTNGIGNTFARNITRGTINNGIRAGAGALRGAVDSVPWSVGEAGLDKLLGYNEERTLPEMMTKNARDFALFSGIAAPVIKSAKWVGKTKPAQEISNDIRDTIGQHPVVSDWLVGLKNFLTSDKKFQKKNDNLSKLEKLNDELSKKPDPTNADLETIANAEGMSVDDFGKMHRELTEGGDKLEAIKREIIEENSTPSKIQADTQFNNEVDKLAYEFKQKPYSGFTQQEQDEFEKYVKEKFNRESGSGTDLPQAPESPTTPVKEKVDTITPKEETIHVKNDSSVSNNENIPDGYYKDDFGNVVKSNKAKIQRFNKEELAKQQDRIGIKPKREIKEEINKEQKFEHVPEEEQQGVNAGKFQDQYRKTNTKTNEINQEDITRLEPGNAEGSNESWNTHAVQNKDNYGDNYDIEASQKQYKRAYENGVEEANTSETAKSSKYVTENENFIKFYENYSKLSDIDKKAVLQTHIRKIKQIEGNKGVTQFLDDFSNQLERDKYRSELGLPENTLSDANEMSNVANAFKKENIDVNNTYSKNGKTKYTITKNKLADKINKAIETKDRDKLQSLIQKNRKLLDKADGDMAKLRDEAYHNASEFSREDMQAALDRGDFEEFEKIYKRTEQIRKNDKTLYEVNEKKEWNPDTKKYEPTGEVWGKEFSKIEDKYTSWEQEIEHWENQYKKAKDVGRVHDYFNGKSSIEKNTTVKLSDLAKRDKMYEQFKDLPDIDISVGDFEELGKNGGALTLDGKNEILFNRNAIFSKELLNHEMQHHSDKAFLNHLKETNDPRYARYKALYDSAIKRNKEYVEFENNNFNKLKRIFKFGELAEKQGIKFEDFINKLPENDKNLYNNYKRLKNKYKRCWFEKRAYDTIETGKILKQEINNGQGQHLGRFQGNIRARGTTSSEGKIEKSNRESRERRELPETERKEQKTGTIKGENIAFERDEKGFKNFHYSPDGLFAQREDLNKAKSLFKTEKEKKLFKDLVKYSLEDEKTLIDLGILTPRQAEARLRKQHYKGEGVYIPSTYKPSKGKIDLEKDYNAGRNTKKGVFGEKKIDGVDREVDAKATTKRAIERHIDIQHIKNVSKTLEDNFAEPIVNGEIKKGYIGVSKNILNTMMYGKYSKDWYKTLTGGMDEISKAFKDKEVKEGWLELFSRSSDKKLNVKYDYQIPESVFNKLVDGSGEKAAEWWSRYANNVKYGKIKGIGHWVGAINDALLNNFKKRALTSSSFFVNNRIGNQIMIAMNSENPIEYLKSYKGMFKYKNKDVPTEIIQNSLLEAAENATVRNRYTGNNAVDNTLNLFNGQLIETKNLKGLKKLAAGTANVVVGLPNKAFNKVSEKVMKFNQLAEDAERRQIFSQIVDKTKRDMIKQTGQNMVKETEILKHINADSEIHALVVKEIEDTLGDYKNFSQAEKKVLKRIVPFYSWYRTITRHTVKVAKEYPERTALLGLILKDLHEKAEKDNRKEYQDYAMKTGIKEKRTGSNLVINKGHAIPYLTFKEFLDEQGKGSLSPLIKTPLEAIRGKKFFLDQEISNNRYIRRGAKWDNKEKKYTDYAYFDTKTQDYVKDKEGKKKLESNYKHGALPVNPRLGYIGKELISNTVAPYLNNSLVNGEKVLTTLNNYRKKGKFEIPDRIYDASFGGYRHGDVVGIEKLKTKVKPVERYVGNRLSTKAQVANALLGLSLQNKSELNRNELKKIEEAKEEVRKRKAKFKKKAS